MSTFSIRLREALDLRGKSQHAIARVVGMTQGEISRMMRGERGERVQYTVVAKLARALNVPIEWLGEGLGPAPAASDVRAEPIPRRREAVRIAREGGLPEHAVEHALAQPVTSDTAEWSTLRWINLMQLAAASAGTMPPPTPPKSSHMRARADTPASGVPSTKKNF